MGRYSTGAITTGGSIRLELSYLLKQGFIQKGCIKQGSLNWTNGSSIGFISCLKDNEKYLQLIYTNTNSISGVVTKHDYKVHLTTIPSNLGRGELIYFVCPASGRKARILYKVYGSLSFKSRKAYRKRIYYPSQISSKLHFHVDRYFELEKKLEKLPKAKKSYYQGKETRLQKRIRNLEIRKKIHDIRRFQILASYMNKIKSLQ